MVLIECSDEAAISGKLNLLLEPMGNKFWVWFHQLLSYSFHLFVCWKLGVFLGVIFVAWSNNCSLVVFWSHIYEFIVFPIIRQETDIHFFASSNNDTKQANISSPSDSTVNWDSYSNRIQHPIATRRAKSQQSKSPNFVPCSTPGGSRHITQGTRTRSTNPFHRTTACRRKK